MYYYDPNIREVKQLLPGIQIRTFWGENVMLSLVDLDAETILPAHSHPHEQGGYVLEGELTFNIGGEIRLVRSGEIFLIPGGVEHSVKVGPAHTKVLDIFSPVRDDLKY